MTEEHTNETNVYATKQFLLLIIQYQLPMPGISCFLSTHACLSCIQIMIWVTQGSALFLSDTFPLERGWKQNFGGPTEDMIKQHLSPQYITVSTSCGARQFVPTVIV
jgi:hypothetical protein